MKKNHIKQLGGVLLIVLIAIWGVLLYNKYFTEKISNYNELMRIEVDEYNFGQLEKAKKILKNVPRGDDRSERFETLKKFNEQYNADIQPKKNCYYVSNYNWDEDYIFGFELESDKYIRKYKSKYYAYPKYDLPVGGFCDWECYDLYDRMFRYTISHPCEK